MGLGLEQGPGLGWARLLDVGVLCGVAVAQPRAAATHADLQRVAAALRGRPPEVSLQQRQHLVTVRARMRVRVRARVRVRVRVRIRDAAEEQRRREQHERDGEPSGEEERHLVRAGGRVRVGLGLG